MPSITPTSYFEDSPCRTMVLDHQHRYLTSKDHPSTTDIAHYVFMSNDSCAMETLDMNGHQCNIHDLVDHTGRYVMASNDLEKGYLPNDKDKDIPPPYHDEENKAGGKEYVYIPRRQIDASNLEVQADIYNNDRAVETKKLEEVLRTNAILRFIFKVVSCGHTYLTISVVHAEFPQFEELLKTNAILIFTSKILFFLLLLVLISIVYDACKGLKSICAAQSRA